MKKIEVGDTVLVKELNQDWHLYMTDMEKILGLKGVVTQVSNSSVSAHGNPVMVEFNTENYSDSWWILPECLDVVSGFDTTRKLYQMTKHERSELIEALMDSRCVVYYYSTSLGEWRVTSTLNRDGVYRFEKKVVHDDVPWDVVSDEYKWFVRDANGNSYLTTDKPCLFRDVLHWARTGKQIDASALSSFRVGNVPWDESIQKRPESV